MTLKKLRLVHFRNIAEHIFDFHPSLTIILGENSQGKTNLLESIYLLCTGKGIKDEKQDEMIQFEQDFTEIKGVFDDVEYDTSLSVRLDRSETVRKAFFIENTRKMLKHYLKSAPPAVLFSPELISVIDGSPASRRSYIDAMLSRIDFDYRKNLTNYESGMRKRNKIIQKEEDMSKLHDSLSFWNDYLITHARYIVEKRKWFCEYLNKHKELSTYVFSIEYKENEISEKRFEEYFEKEWYQKRTLIGPQRDDYIIYKLKEGKEVDVHKYCSRGEQRLALFWLICCYIQLIEQELHIKPILLLDDIFSELDEHNKMLIFDLIGNYQTIITTTEKNTVKEIKNDNSIIEI